MRKIDDICIIDDDTITVFGIRKMLGLVVDCENIVSYANGKLALEGIKAMYRKTDRVPSVIFLDINMPIMDGWQFLAEFIAMPLNQKVRINVVTSSIAPLDRKQYEDFKERTSHTLSFNNKPLRKQHMAKITKMVD